MRICITRSEKYSYSETFIRDQLAGFSKFAEVYPIHTSRLPERAEDGSLLSSWSFWILHKIVKVITGRRNNHFSNSGLKKYFLDNKIDVVLANYGLTAAHLAPICKAAGIPLLVIFHGHDASDKKLLHEYRTKYRALFSYASVIIAVSEDMKNKLIELGAAPEKVTVISCGVDTAKFKPSSANKEKIFLAVGRFVDKKGPLHTIRAFHEVWKKHPAARLIMAGAHSGLYREAKKLTDSLDMHDVVLFPGIVPHEEVRQLMNKAFAFVQHSLTAANGDMEGTPVGILEAAAAGLPVISTLHGGIREAVVHGKTGCLVPEGDTKAMAGYMIQLLEDELLVSEMRQAARNHILEHYDQEKQIKKLSDQAIRATTTPHTS